MTPSKRRPLLSEILYYRRKAVKPPEDTTRKDRMSATCSAIRNFFVIFEALRAFVVAFLSCSELKIPARCIHSSPVARILRHEPVQLRHDPLQFIDKRRMIAGCAEDIDQRLVIPEDVVAAAGLETRP